MSAAAPRHLATKLSKGLVTCSPQASLYGQCVVANLDNLGKDSCAKEFQHLKTCYQEWARKTKLR